MALTNGTVALDYSGDGTVDTNLGFSMNVTFDYSSSGPLGNSIVTTNENGAVPGYVHVAAEYDSSLNLGAYNASQTSAHIGDDSSVNSVDWTLTPRNSMTVTDQGSGVPGSIVIHNDAFLSNFALASDAIDAREQHAHVRDGFDGRRAPRPGCHNLRKNDTRQATQCW